MNIDIIKQIALILLKLDDLAEKLELYQSATLKNGFNEIVEKLLIYIATEEADKVIKASTVLQKFDSLVDEFLGGFLDQDQRTSVYVEVAKLGMEYLNLFRVVPHPNYKTVEKNVIDTGLERDYILIKDIMDDGKKVVTSTITQAIISGAKPEEIVRALGKKLRITENNTPVPLWRLKLQSRNETMATLRLSSYSQEILYLKHLGKDIDEAKWQHHAIHDDRLSDICRHLNERPIRTKAEWDSVSPNWFIYGNHVNCRCTWSLVL